MGIERASIAVLRLPFKSRYATSKVVRQPNADSSTHVLVKLQMDDGIVGYGEVPTNDFLASSVCQLIRERFIPTMLGVGYGGIFSALAKLMLLIGDDWRDAACRLAFALVEMACIDSLSKYLNLPAYSILGGKVIERFQIALTVPLLLPEWIYDYASSFEHPSWIKLNIAGEVFEDLDRVGEVARVHPQAQIWLDPDGGFKSPSEALLFLEQVGGVGNVALCLSPVDGSNLLLLERVRHASPLPIAADEECTTPQDVALLAHIDAADMIALDIPKMGGISAALRAAHVATAHGLEVIIRTKLSTQIGIAAALHTFCGLRVRVGMEVDGLQFLLAPIARGIEMNGVSLAVPDSPGFGIEVDESAIGEFAIKAFEVP